MSFEINFPIVLKCPIGSSSGVLVSLELSADSHTHSCVVVVVVVFFILTMIGDELGKGSKDLLSSAPEVQSC